MSIKSEKEMATGKELQAGEASKAFSQRLAVSPVLDVCLTCPKQLDMLDLVHAFSADRPIRHPRWAVKLALRQCVVPKCRKSVKLSFLTGGWRIITEK